jgi:putative LysE/RhtB family amino acid efflux pump
MDIPFWKGIFIGLLIALPSGPVSFLIIRRIYVFGIKTGIYSVVGALITDIFYIVVVGFGLKSIQRFLGMTTGYAEIIAGIIIIVSGYKIMKEREKRYFKYSFTR